jgi:hypothetical protein
VDVNIIHRAIHRLADYIGERTKRDGFYDYIAFNEDISGEYGLDCILRIGEESTGEIYASYKFNEENFAETFHSDYKKFAIAFNNKYCDNINEWTNKKWMKLPLLGEESWKRSFHEVYKESESSQNKKLLLVI